MGHRALRQQVSNSSSRVNGDSDGPGAAVDQVVEIECSKPRLCLAVMAYRCVKVSRLGARDGQKGPKSIEQRANEWRGKADPGQPVQRRVEHLARLPGAFLLQRDHAFQRDCNRLQRITEGV